MSVVGALILSIVTAVGGGTIRDLLLAPFQPAFWVSDPRYLSLCVASCVLALLFLQDFPISSRPLVLADALSLGAFSVLGSRAALARRAPALFALLSGWLTASGGGMND
ncbi:hypothetical protein TeGR_g2766 [Tetraparma gracilis]|uniref:Glycine transporter domain-containing protein n=1 Tax=Tetraparma gracilis TaxID=2962635 RepID=A0ABQ6MK28_9STRA|nr:hypothetical protein TeGR_g2766 [Tetraparma gracilis]